MFLSQVHREVIPTHTVYALNIERIIMKLWHPNHEELQQDKVHRQRLAAKEGLLFCWIRIWQCGTLSKLIDYWTECLGVHISRLRCIV